MADALAAVRRLSSAVLGAGDHATVYHELASAILGALDVDEVQISRVLQDLVTGRGNAYLPGPGEAAEMGAEYELELDEGSAVRSVATSGEPVSEPGGLFLPLAYDDQVRVVVGCMPTAPRVFGDDEVQVAQTLVNQATAAIRMLDLRAHIDARAGQEAALARAARSLNARLDLHTVLETLCREADQALGADLAGVYLGDADDGGRAVAAHGIPKDSGWFDYVIRPGEGVGGQVLMTGRPAISNDYRRDVQVPANEALEGVQTAVSVPLRWNGELKGALSVAFCSMREVSDEDIAALQALADLAGVACTNAQAFEQIQTAARTDSLTGLLNHGAVHAKARDEIARAQRSGEPLCCLLADLDNFKPINDQHGHLAGDRILKEIAAKLTEEFRAYDGIGRFGGDEFLVVLPGLTEEEADQAAARFQDAVAAARPMGNAAALTTSVGIARWHEPLMAAELIDRADRALLVAKRSGKDRAVLSTDKTEEELARLEAAAGTPNRVLAALWDMVSRCERPSEVLLGLPDFMRDALGLESATFVDAAKDPALAEQVRRLGGTGVARPSMLALRQALGAMDLPVSGGDGGWAAVPLARDGTAYGLLVLRSPSHLFPLATLRLSELIAGQAVTALLGQTGGASRSAVGALAAAIDARDDYTHAHSEQVVSLATEVATRLGLDPAQIEHVRDGAMLHDVGKVAIPNEILFKPGPLDATSGR